MGKSSSVKIGDRYYLGAHAWLHQGVADRIVAIRLDEKYLAYGSFEDGTRISVDKPSLFGGDEKGGGFVGEIDVMCGAADQAANDYLSAQMTGAVSGFRRITSLVFRRPYWGNEPRIPPMDVVAQRIDKVGLAGAEQWYPATAKIPSDALLAGASGDFSNAITYAEPDVGIGTVYATGDTGYNWRNRTIGLTTAQHLWRTTDRTVGSFTFSKGAYDYWIDCPGGASTGRFSFFRERWSNIVPTGVTSDQVEVRITAEMARDTSSVSGSIGIRTSDNGTAAFSGTYGTVGFSGSETEWSEKDSGWVQITDNATDLYLSFAAQFGTIGIRNLQLAVRGDFGVILYDMNPAHAHREKLVVKRRIDPALIDDDAYRALADLLYDEGFGMSRYWRQGETAQQQMREYEEAANFVGFVDRRTGLHTVKAIRNDYDPDTIPHFTNVISADVKTEIASELPNTVVVKYWDWARMDMGAISLPNPAKVQIDGGVNETEIAYEGIRKAALASRVAQRELRAATTPKKFGIVKLTRAAADLERGDAFRVTEPRYNLNGEVLRVTDVDEGDGLSNQVTVTFVQDAYDLGNTAPVLPVDPPPDSLVSDPAAASPRLVEEAPYLELVNYVGDAEAQSSLEATPDAGFVLVAAAGADGTQEYAQIHVDDGGGYAQKGRIDFTEAPVLTAALSADPTVTSATISDAGFLALDEYPRLALIGTEIVNVISISGTTLTLGRGCLDTVPQAHAAGAAVIMWGGFSTVLPTRYDLGETVDVKLLSVTGTGVLDISDAPVDEVTMASRAVRPYPPGKLQIGGAYLPLAISDGAVMTWAHRDRLTQTDGTVYDFTYGNIGPESGVSYRVDLTALDAGGASLGVYHTALITGSPPTPSYTLDAADYQGLAPAAARDVRISVTTLRGSGSPPYESWQSPSITVPIFDVDQAEDGQLDMAEDGELVLEE